jgi:glucose/arabinose dehydrogenase
MMRKNLVLCFVLAMVAGVGCTSGVEQISTELVIATPLEQGATTTPAVEISPTYTPKATLPPTATDGTPAEPPQQVATDLQVIQIDLRPVAEELDQPVGLTHAGDGSGRLFVIEKVGKIRTLHGETLSEAPFLDITGRVSSQNSERGLLGLAFHPNYADNGLFFVNYTDRQGDTVVARFAVTDDPDQADPDSEAIVLTVTQPAPNHNGGNIVFGPDGYLYIGLGDGGDAGDAFGNGQNGQTPLGAMLRIDVNADDGAPYRVPPDNPFTGDPRVLDEIWAIGLRNPWRYSFDRLTGDLYIADVGQNVYEEVNIQPAASPGGENYGWPIMEGQHCYPESASCGADGLALPVIEYDHTQGCSVTGGYVYRGKAFPALEGVYLFGDYCSGRIWGLAPGGDGTWQVAELIQSGVQISSFGEDEAGEIYVLDMREGALYQIAARP